jgi:hypothetical protein
MMFLTRGDLHHEPVWNLWFRHAEGLLPVSALKVHGCGSSFLGHLQQVCMHLPSLTPTQQMLCDSISPLIPAMHPGSS